VGGDPSTWAPKTTPEIIIEPLIVGGNPSTWGPVTPPTPLIVGGDPSTWGPVTPEPVIDIKPLPLYDCETPHPPEGDCSILYAECAFKGCF